MTYLRKVTAVALSIALALGFTACEKPKPQITVTSGTSSVAASALCWSDQAPLDTTACSKVIGEMTKPTADLPVITLMRDQTIGISVDPTVAKYGWNIRLADQNINPTTIKSTYYRFTNPLGSSPANGQYLLVLANSQAQGARGIWLLKVRQD